jgi:hypothetical protein
MHIPRPAKHKAPVRNPRSGSAARRNRPDLLEEVAWWQIDDFWQYALSATVAYIRAAANRAGAPLRQACQDLAQHQHHPAP